MKYANVIYAKPFPKITGIHLCTFGCTYIIRWLALVSFAGARQFALS